MCLIGAACVTCRREVGIDQAACCHWSAARVSIAAGAPNLSPCQACMARKQQGEARVVVQGAPVTCAGCSLPARIPPWPVHMGLLSMGSSTAILLDLRGRPPTIPA